MKPIGTQALGFRTARRRRVDQISICTITSVLFLDRCVLPFLYAIHAKSETDEKNRPGQNEKMGSLARSIAGRAANTRSRSLSTAGAEAECFDDLITALANANVNSTFFITGRFVNDHANWVQRSQSMATKSETTPGVISI